MKQCGWWGSHAMHSTSEGSLHVLATWVWRASSTAMVLSIDPESMMVDSTGFHLMLCT